MRRCRLNCLSAVEAIGRPVRSDDSWRVRSGSLNCLSAVEAIGSAGRHLGYEYGSVEVSIAFRLLKRLVAIQ